VRLLIDANLSAAGRGCADRRRHDVVHVFEIGLADASDEAILARAESDERVIVSSDTDFGASWPATSGRRLRSCYFATSTT
jgi:predicted nuclease of predicted toxin-antitoxin system